jgi:hypothetical protein
MALGIWALFILCTFGLGIVILLVTPKTASAYNCFVTMHDCLETRDPVELK